MGWPLIDGLRPLRRGRAGDRHRGGSAPRGDTESAGRGGDSSQDLMPRRLEEGTGPPYPRASEVHLLTPSFQICVSSPGGDEFLLHELTQTVLGKQHSSAEFPVWSGRQTDRSSILREASGVSWGGRRSAGCLLQPGGQGGLPGGGEAGLRLGAGSQLGAQAGCLCTVPQPHTSASATL